VQRRQHRQELRHELVLEKGLNLTTQLANVVQESQTLTQQSLLLAPQTQKLQALWQQRLLPLYDSLLVFYKHHDIAAGQVGLAVLENPLKRLQNSQLYVANMPVAQANVNQVVEKAWPQESFPLRLPKEENIAQQTPPTAQPGGAGISLADSLPADSFTVINSKEELPVFMRYDFTAKVQRPYEQYFTQQLNPHFTQTQAGLNGLIDLLQQYRQKGLGHLERQQRQMYWWLVLAVAVILGLSYLAWRGPLRFFQKGMVPLRGALKELRQGNLPATVPSFNNEFDLLGQPVNDLRNEMAHLQGFAQQVGQGQFGAGMKVFNQNSTVGQALVNMETGLQEVARQEHNREWASKGRQEVGKLLRLHTEDLEALARQLMAFLTSYLDFVQAGMFVATASNQQGQETALKLIASYAYNRQKYLQKTVLPGQGFVGQCWLEKAPIYLLEVPPEYMQITSGLGHTPPTALYFQPLLANNEILGVMEFAAMQKISPEQRAFIDQVAQLVASALKGVQNAEETKQLLEQGKVLQEQFKAQEEVMQESIKTLQKEQDALKRNTTQQAFENQVLEKLLYRVELDTKQRIIDISPDMAQLLGYALDEIAGMPFERFMKQQDTRNALSFSALWQALEDGQEQQSDFLLRTKAGKHVWIHGMFKPQVRGSYLNKVLLLGYNITAGKNTVNQLQLLEQQLAHSVAVVTFNALGTIVNANQVFLNALDVDQATAQKENWNSLVEEGQPTWQEMDRPEAFAQNGLQHVSVAMAYHANNAAWWQGTLHKHQQEQKGAYTLYAANITPLMQNVQQLEAQMQSLEAAAKAPVATAPAPAATGKPQATQPQGESAAALRAQMLEAAKKNDKALLEKLIQRHEALKKAIQAHKLRLR